MHVPDAFLDAPTSLATGGVAIAGVALALRRTRSDLDDRAPIPVTSGRIQLREHAGAGGVP